MSKERRKLVLEKCRQTSILLQAIQPALVPWGVERGKLDQRFTAVLSKIEEQVRMFPKTWVPMTAGQLASSSVLGNPSRIQEYLDGPGKDLSAHAATFLHHLQQRPAFFTGFGVQKALGDDLFEIRDYSSDDVQLLCSSALAESIKSNPESYLTLLFSNGSCLQTIGPLHFYRGLASVDFHYYARLLRPGLYDRSGLSVVMTEVPENFVILDAFTEVPPIGHRGKRLYCFSSSFTATGLDPAALSSSFDVEEAKGMMRFRLRGSDPPFALADLYWNPAGEEAFIYSKNWDDYQRIVAAVAAHPDAPSEPQMVCTQNMEVIASNLLGVEPPFHAWQAPFEPPPASPQEEESTRRINALLQDLADAANHGRTYDLARIAARHGVAMDVAREMEEMLKSQAGSMSIDVPGGLIGVPALPPSGRVYLQEDLHSCKLFRFSTGDEAQRLFKDVAAGVEALRPKSRVSRTRTMLTLATLPIVLEEIDDPPVEDSRHAVLKYTMYLLCGAGSEYHSTADYAAEILRLFWQVLVPSRERADFRRFTRQYAVWCRQILVRTGLAEEDGQEKSGRPGAPFSMRTTSFFRAWVRLGKTS